LDEGAWTIHSFGVVMVAQSDVIGGRYHLEERIGEGGMGVVWRATDLTLARSVALKLLFAPGERERERSAAQFLREARLSGAVQHRNVVHITDFGTTPGGSSYMVMELLEGETLADLLDRDGMLRWEWVMRLAARILDGLAAVHAASIVHRDLKPENVFLVTDPDPPFPKLLDFGISRSIDPASGRRSPHTTCEGLLVGTPEYMSPEQVRGLRDIDHRSDLYALGVILYEALTGQIPYSSENRGDLIIAIAAGGAPPPHQVNPTIPIAVSDLITKAIARARDDRFFDAREMRQAVLAAVTSPHSPLTEALARVPEDGITTVPPPSLVQAMHQEARRRVVTLDEMSDEMSDEVRPRSRAWTGVLAAAVLLAVAGGGWAWQAGWWKRGLASVPATSMGRSPGTMASEADPELVAHDSPAHDPPLVEATPSTNSLPADDSVEVSLLDLPPGASVSIDGETWSGPLTQPLILQADGTSRRIEVTVAGHAPFAVDHDSSTGGVYTVGPLPRTSARGVSRRRPPRRARPTVDEPEATPAPTLAPPADGEETALPPRTFRQLDY
jgi:serine/threonine-protein kinase